MLQSDRGRELSEELRDTRSKPQARQTEVLFDVPQLTFDDFQEESQS